MTRIINTPKALLVEVPEGASDFTINPYAWELQFFVNGRLYVIEIEINRGQPILAGEMGEEDLLNILEFWDSATGGGDYQDYYKNYETETPENYMHLFHFTCPEESFASLLSSHNLKPETTVVIPKTI